MTDNTVVPILAPKLQKALAAAMEGAPHLEDTVDIVDRSLLNLLIKALRGELDNVNFNSSDGYVDLMCNSLEVAIYLALLTRHPRDIGIARRLLSVARKDPDNGDTVKKLAEPIKALRTL